MLILSKPIFLNGYSFSLIILGFILIGITLLSYILFRFITQKINIEKQKFQTLNSSFIDIIQSTKDGFMLFNEKGNLFQFNETGLNFIQTILLFDTKEKLRLNEVLKNLQLYCTVQLSEENLSDKVLELKNIEIPTSKGSHNNFYLRIHSIYSNQKITYTYFIIRDISEEVKRISEEKDTHYFINEIINNSRDAYLILDKNFIVKSANNQALISLGVPTENIIGISLLSKFPELVDSELIANCEFVQFQKTPIEIDYFLISQNSWFNVKIQPNKQGLTLFFYENTHEKLTKTFNEIERKALEQFSTRSISFYQIIANAIDSIQELFPGMFCAIYMLNEEGNELKFFSSGYSTFLPTVPKSINSGFLGFDYILQKKIRIERNNLYFDFLTNLFLNKTFSRIFNIPIAESNKVKGVILSYMTNDSQSFSNIEKLQDQMRLLIEKLFSYSKQFKELEKLSIVSENSQKSFATININNQITWTNKSFNNLFLMTTEDLLLSPLTTIINEKNTDTASFEIIHKGIDDFENIALEFSYSSDEIKKQLNLTTRKLFSGSDIQLLIEIEDVTAQVTFRNELQKGQEFLKKVTDKVPIVLFQIKIDANGAFSFPFISKEIERYDIGMTIEKIYQFPGLLFKLIHPDDLPKITSVLDITQDNLPTWQVEFRLMSSNYQNKWINGIGVPEKQNDGSVIWYGYFEDISDKKEKNLEIQKINERFKYVSKAVNEVIWELDLSDNSMIWSDGLTTIFGYAQNKYPMFQNIQKYIHPDDFENYAAGLFEYQMSKNQHNFSLEYRFKKADNTFASVIDKVFVIRNEQGDPQRIIGSIKDISESKLFEINKKILINETQEFERNQFSMELHDGLAQQLVALNLYLSRLEDDVPTDKIEKLAICKKIVIESLNQTRTLCYNLSPPELSNGLIHGLKAMYDRLNALEKTIFIFKHEEESKLKNINNIDIYNVYRIIQEFVNNSIKHAKCTEIRCTIKQKNTSKLIEITLVDNGIGYDPKLVKYGFGVQNIHKRANLANAKIKLESKLGVGSSLIITV